jgi:hypothetical protein
MGNHLLGSLKRLENNIKMNIKEIGCRDQRWIKEAPCSV